MPHMLKKITCSSNVKSGDIVKSTFLNTKWEILEYHIEKRGWTARGLKHGSKLFIHDQSIWNGNYMLVQDSQACTPAKPIDPQYPAFNIGDKIVANLKAWPDLTHPLIDAGLGWHLKTYVVTNLITFSSRDRDVNNVQIVLPDGTPNIYCCSWFKLAPNSTVQVYQTSIDQSKWGKCPQCGKDGDFVNLGYHCPEHGNY